MSEDLQPEEPTAEMQAYVERLCEVITLGVKEAKAVGDGSTYLREHRAVSFACARNPEMQRFLNVNMRILMMSVLQSGGDLQQSIGSLVTMLVTGLVAGAQLGPIPFPVVKKETH